jgi:hypothetical protein
MTPFPRHSFIGRSEVVGKFGHSDAFKLSLHTQEQVLVWVLQAVKLYCIILAVEFPVSAV